MIDRWYGITCDTCGASGEILDTVDAARAAAKEDGWDVGLPAEPHGHRRSPRRDLCPLCRTTRDNQH